MSKHGVGANAVTVEAIAGITGAKSDTDIDCGKVRNSATPCQERLGGTTARAFARPARFLRPNGSCLRWRRKQSASFMTYPNMVEVR